MRGFYITTCSLEEEQALRQPAAHKLKTLSCTCSQPNCKNCTVRVGWKNQFDNSSSSAALTFHHPPNLFFLAKPASESCGPPSSCISVAAVQLLASIQEWIQQLFEWNLKDRLLWWLVLRNCRWLLLLLLVGSQTEQLLWLLEGHSPPLKKESDQSSWKAQR